MIEPTSWNDTTESVEAMIRAAGQYVGASDDLRPQVLEAARLQSKERRARRYLRLATVAVVGLALLSIEVRQEVAQRIAASPSSWGIEAFISPASADGIHSEKDSWRLIDAFTKLRRQQAQTLRCEI